MSDDEPFDSLVDELLERQLEVCEKVKQTAFHFVSQEGPRNSARFFKGLEEGYRLFLDAEGKYSGDRGRTAIYLELIICQLEIEKMRRRLPARSRNDFYDYIQDTTELPAKRYKWFNDICDEIGLSAKGVGRPFKFAQPHSVPLM